MSMRAEDYLRAAVSGGLLGAASWWMSGRTDNVLIVGGLQAVSTLVSDRVHSVLMSYPTTISGALGTGAAYTAARYVIMGETDYMTNVGYSAAADFGARTATDMLLASQNAAAMDDTDDGETY